MTKLCQMNGEEGTGLRAISLPYTFTHQQSGTYTMIFKPGMDIVLLVIINCVLFFCGNLCSHFPLIC